MGYEISKGKNLLAICMLLFGISEVILCLTLQKLNLTKKKLEILNISNEDYIEKQKEYLKTINEKNIEIRKFRHDYKEHVYVIGGLLTEKKYDELERYLKQLYDIKEKLDYINVGNDIVNAVLNHYNEIMKEKNITFSCRGRIPQKIESISETALCGIFSNIVKNAIEATEKTENKNIQLTLSCYKEIKIRLENDAICPKTQDGKLISDKNDSENHGIGMMNVKQYVEDTGGLINWEYKDEKFIVKIVFPIAIDDKRLESKKK